MAEEFPTQELVGEAFDLYTAAVGRVVTAWNSLHDRLESLFWKIIETDPGMALAIWRSSFSDRSQRQMLEAAIKASVRHPAWKQLPGDAKDDLLWLLKRCNHLGDKRDDVIHLPGIAYQITGSNIDVVANDPYHRRGKTLFGKELLVEFDWLERYIIDLSAFAYSAFGAIAAVMLDQHGSAWPERPRAPDRRPKTALQGRLRRPPPKSQSLPPRSSQA